jgi:RNA polymerase sigma-70 factor (ECF subfamily)
MSDSDRELMNRVKNGDMSAFDLIVQKHKVSLINFAFRFLGDHETAEDLAQETFLRVYRNAGRYNSEKARLNTWMYRIAANLCKNELRSRSRRSKVMVNPAIGNQDGGNPIEKVLDTSPGPDHQLEKEELKKTLAEAISRLPEKLRIVLILRDIEGLTYEEICEIIKKPLGTVKSRLNRARLMLRSKMTGYVEG